MKKHFFTCVLSLGIIIAFVLALPTSALIRSPDVNRDGLVNTTDLNFIESAMNSSGTCQLNICDLNNDGVITNPDRQLITKYMAFDEGDNSILPITPSVTFTNGLILKWTFDNINGSTVTDDSGVGNNGAINKATVTTGYTSKGMNFNGKDGGINSKLRINQLSSSKGVTVSMWVYPRPTKQEDTVMSTDNGGFDWSIIRDINNQWVVFTGENRKNTGLKADLNAWQQLKVTFDPTTRTVTFQKNKDKKTIKSLGFDSSVNTFTIGRNPSYGATFNGIIDEVEVYGNAQGGDIVPITPPITPSRPPDDIVIPSGSPVVEWHFESIVNDYVIDSSAWGNNGRISKATQTDGYSGKGIRLDGVNSYVKAPIFIDQSASSKGVSFSLWVKPEGTSAQTLLSTDNGGWDWSIWHDGKTWFVSSGEDARSSGFPVDFGVWQQLTVIFDPTTKSIHFYKNSDKSDIPYLGFDSNANYLTLGKNPSFGYNFQGVVDDVIVYPFVKEK